MVTGFRRVLFRSRCYRYARGGAGAELVRGRNGKTLPPAFPRRRAQLGRLQPKSRGRQSIGQTHAQPVQPESGRSVSVQFGWNIDLGAMARIWRGGCIIRARFLDDITRAYDENPNLPSLLTAPVFASSLATVLPAWRQVVATSATTGVPAPAFASSLVYVDQLRSSSCNFFLC